MGCVVACPVETNFILGQLNSLQFQKKKNNISSCCTEFTLTLKPFSSLKKRGSMMRCYEMTHHTVTPSERNDFIIHQSGLSVD